jgi:hypothetical protein
VDEAIQVPGRFFYCLPHLIVAVEIEHVGNEVEGILVVLDLRVQACEVEPICEVVFVDFAKVFIAARGYELEVAKESC